MENYRWCPDVLDEVFILPAAVTDRELALASPEQVKVLLWLSRRHMAWDAATCGQDLGLSPDEAAGCVHYWAERGLITVPGIAAPAQTPAAAPKAAIARPAAVKPLPKEVLAYQQAHPEFSAFAEAAGARLGKAIGHGDVATLLYLHTTVGLPMEVILMEIAYAVSMGKANMRYVEKLALNWADEDLTTVPAVDARIRQLEAGRVAAARVEKLLGLPRPLTAAQAELAYKWVDVWQFTDGMLSRAGDITTENTGKFNAGYMDKILEGWKAEGIDTPEKIPAASAKKKGAAATNPEQSGLDIDTFEEELLRYRPRMPGEPSGQKKEG